MIAGTYDLERDVKKERTLTVLVKREQNSPQTLPKRHSVQEEDKTTAFGIGDLCIMSVPTFYGRYYAPILWTESLMLAARMALRLSACCANRGSGHHVGCHQRP